MLTQVLRLIAVVLLVLSFVLLLAFDTDLRDALGYGIAGLAVWCGAELAER